jgi:hypothetical protein
MTVVGVINYLLVERKAHSTGESSCFILLPQAKKKKKNKKNQMARKMVVGWGGCCYRFVLNRCDVLSAFFLNVCVYTCRLPLMTAAGNKNLFL